jgi:hypothetical protein
MAEKMVGVVQYGIVKVAGMCIEESGLVAQRRHNLGMTVPNDRYIVVRVQILAARRIVQPDTSAAHNMKGLPVKEAIGWPQKSSPSGNAIFEVPR